jgi:hypothetical protein
MTTTPLYSRRLQRRDPDRLPHCGIDLIDDVSRQRLRAQNSEMATWFNGLGHTSPQVGTSGSSLRRCGGVTATATSLPYFTKGYKDGRLSRMMSTWPPTTAVNPGQLHGFACVG